MDVGDAAFGTAARVRCTKAAAHASIGCAPRERGYQVHLVGIAEDLLGVGLTSVDHQEDGVVAAWQGKVVEQVGQSASRRQRDVEAAQPALRRAPLQCGVEMNTDRDVYQLKMLSRSASAAS